MKLTIIALTDQGEIIARKIRSAYPEADSYLFEKASSRHQGLQRFGKLRELVTMLWETYQALVFIMAAGIVVRQIAPLIRGKNQDPAVIVIDENGEYVIPILSGHLGGANALAKILAQELQAHPVITTATDLRGLMAPDEYARRLNWKIYPLTKLSQINSRLLERRKLVVVSECKLKENHPLRKDSSYVFTTDKEEADLIISASPNDERFLYLIPPVYSVGIGCRKGVPAKDVINAITTVFQTLGYSPQSISGLYSISQKADEQGLHEAAADLGVTFKTFTPDQIQETLENFDLERSAWVRKNMGVDGVCEPASLLGSNDGQLIIHKTRIGKVTIAVCREKSIS